MLETSYNSMINEQKSDHYNLNEVRNSTQSEKAQNQTLKIEELAGKFSENTLFFIFYYQQNTFKQLLAAEELTKRKW